MPASRPGGAVDLSVTPCRNVNAHKRSADATGNRAMSIRRELLRHARADERLLFNAGFSSEPEHKSGIRIAVRVGRPRDARWALSWARTPLRPYSRATAVPLPHPARQNHIKTIKKLDNAHDDLANLRSYLYRGPLTRRT